MAGLLNYQDDPVFNLLGDVYKGAGGLIGDTVKNVWGNMDTLDRAALTTSPVPVVGDVVGAINDARYLYEEPSLANAGMAGLGLLPFVPSLGMVKRMSKAEAEDAGYWHPVGSKKKLDKPFDQLSREVEPTNTVRPHSEINPESLQGGVLIPALGDRSDIGYDLVKVGDNQLANPVTLQGGHGYMREGDESIWASGKGMISRLNNKAQDIIDSGKDPYLAYLPAAHNASDFSAMMTDSILEQIRASDKVSPTAKLNFDRKLRKLRPEWKGIDSPEAIEQLNSVGELRRAFVQVSNLDYFKGRGFPDISETRFAITDPNLMDVNLLQGGQSISKASGNLIENPSVVHNSYPQQMGGEYVGGIEKGVPSKILFPDFYKQRRAAGKPTASDYRSFDLTKPTQDMNQEWIDNVMKNLQGYK